MNWKTTEVERNGIRSAVREPCCCQCNATDGGVNERYSLGIYAGTYCDKCWDKSGYRKEGPGGFDPMDAGESYDPV